MWPDRRVIELFGVEHPISLAPMAGPGTAELAIAVAEAGGTPPLARSLRSSDQRWLAFISGCPKPLY